MRVLITLLAKSHEPPSIAQVCGVDIVEDAVKTSQVLLRATRFSFQGVRFSVQIVCEGSSKSTLFSRLFQVLAWVSFPKLSNRMRSVLL